MNPVLSLTTTALNTTALNRTALNSDQIGKLGLGAIAAVVVVGLIVAMIVSAVVGRLVVLVIVVGLGVLIWQQRTSIENHVKNCDPHMSFFGYHVDMPADIAEQCKNLQGRATSR